MSRLPVASSLLVLLITVLFAAGCASSQQSTPSSEGTALTFDVTADRLFVLAKQIAKSNGYHNFEDDPYAYNELSQSFSAWKDVPLAFKSSSRSFSNTSPTGTNQPYIRLRMGIDSEGTKSTIKLRVGVRNAGSNDLSSTMSQNIAQSEERCLLRKISEAVRHNIARYSTSS